MEKYSENSGHLRLCQQPRAAHALRSDQLLSVSVDTNIQNHHLIHKIRTFVTTFVMIRPVSVTDKIFLYFLLFFCHFLHSSYELERFKEQF